MIRPYLNALDLAQCMEERFDREGQHKWDTVTGVFQFTRNKLMCLTMMMNDGDVHPQYLERR